MERSQDERRLQRMNRRRDEEEGVRVLEELGQEEKDELRKNEDGERKEKWGKCMNDRI